MIISLRCKYNNIDENRVKKKIIEKREIAGCFYRYCQEWKMKADDGSYNNIKISYAFEM
jgi:hypothetical protein